MTTHSLKVRTEHFAWHARGLKTFEWRTNDRGFVPGDWCELCEIDDAGELTGRVVYRRITHLAEGPTDTGIPSGYVILSLWRPQNDPPMSSAPVPAEPRPTQPQLVVASEPARA